ncbi:MAG: Mur ligase family protein, partial [Mariprofundales bacterium]|nr:Mur ligase family protein [Mariprofundales bacterium]
HAKTLILNNLEFDHADIFPDLAAIEQQFAYLLRCVPSSGLVVVNGDDAALAAVINRGCWTPCSYFSRYGGDGEWQWQTQCEDGSSFSLYHNGELFLQSEWALIGEHNVANACAAVAASAAYGIDAAQLQAGLSSFTGVQRRMTLVGEVGGVRLFDDFAHHPTAIKGVVTAMRTRMRQQGEEGRLWVVVEPRSNTMRGRVHQQRLAGCFADADYLRILPPKASGMVRGELLDVQAICDVVGSSGEVVASVNDLLDDLACELRAGDVVLALSNGSFDNFHQRLLTRLRQG